MHTSIPSTAQIAAQFQALGLNINGVGSPSPSPSQASDNATPGANQAAPEAMSVDHPFVVITSGTNVGVFTNPELASSFMTHAFGGAPTDARSAAVSWGVPSQDSNRGCNGWCPSSQEATTVCNGWCTLSQPTNGTQARASSPAPSVDRSQAEDLYHVVTAGSNVGIFTNHELAEESISSTWGGECGSYPTLELAIQAFQGALDLDNVRVLP